MREASKSRTVTDTDSYAFSSNNKRQREDDRGIFKTMEINEAKAIVELMNCEFDSHDFISLFLQHFPTSYAKIISKHDYVNSAHGEIARFLRTNAEELKIILVANDSESPNIYNNLSKNAKWQKKVGNPI